PGRPAARARYRMSPSSKFRTRDGNSARAWPSVPRGAVRKPRGGVLHGVNRLVVPALLCVGAAMFSGFGHEEASSSPGSGPSARVAAQLHGLPPAGRVVGTLRFSVREAPLFTTRSGSLF